MGNILTPLMPPYSPELAEVMKQYPQQDGYLLKLFRVFANSVRFAKKAVPNLLDNDSPLSLREREIIILRTTANNDCEYEWGVHVTIFAPAAGFSEDQIAATKNARCDDPVWDDKEKALLAPLMIYVVREPCFRTIWDGFSNYGPRKNSWKSSRYAELTTRSVLSPIAQAWGWKTLPPAFPLTSPPASGFRDDACRDACG